MKSHPAYRAALLVAAVAGLAIAGVLAAHDFWIIPDAFQVAGGGMLEIRGQTSTRFPTSEAAVAPDRVAEARLIGADGEERMTDLTTAGRSLVIRHRPSGTGQRVVAVALTARAARTTPEQLRRYIGLEGAPELADRYAREGRFPQVDSLTRVSAKFAKTLVELGGGGSRAFDRLAGHTLELVPLSDPTRLRAGDTLAIRLLYRGQPVPGAQLHGGPAPRGLSPADTARAPAGERRDTTVETGADGVARVAVAEPGLWNVRVVHGGPAPAEPGGLVTWEVHFATLVFEVAPQQHRH